MIKKVIPTILIILAILITPISAQVLTRDQLNFDNNLIDENRELKFAEPQSIMIVPISPPTGNINVGTTEWIQGIYYYLAGRLNLGDIQFHYLVGEDGTVVRGLRNGPEQVIPVNSDLESPVVIAYLTNGESNDFSRISTEPLGELILDVANKNQVPLSQVFVRRVDFVAGEDGFEMIVQEALGRYDQSLENIISSIEGRYDPVEKNYSVEILQVDQPEGKVEPGDDVVISLTVKNNSPYSIFKGGDSEIIATTADNSISRFYSSRGDWISQSQIAIMPEGEVLEPSEEATYDIRMQIPLYFGQQSQSFVLTNLEGTTIDNSNFTINLDVAEVDGTVIEIQDTETGTLNVRRTPGGEVFDSVLPGERFIELDRTTSGWSQIELSDGSKGWVSVRYVNVI